MGTLGHHLIAAFMRLLSEASRGGRGVLSLTSTPAQTSRATGHVVVCRVRDGDRASEGFTHGMDPLDHFFAVMVLRMGLLGEDDLQTSRRSDDLLQPVQIVKHQRPTFVGGRPSGEAESQHVPIEACIGLDLRLIT